MSEGNVQSILRCGICNKPFDKESTLKRHRYYCRSKQPGNTSRARSCIYCVQRKARCDSKRPECSRCMGKGIQCTYPANTAKDTKRQHNDDVLTEQVLHLLESNYPALNTQQVSTSHDDVFLNSSLAEKYLDDNMKAVQTQQRNPSLIHSFAISIPAQPTSALRLLVSRPSIKIGGKSICSLLMHALKSFPQMMLQHNTLPPFIHTRLTSPSIEDNNMELLLNCINLVRMISSGAHGSRKLFWKNVRQECERMYEDNLKFNRWELLAAMQALSIYILVRLGEGETDHNNFDFLLIAAITVIAKQLGRIDFTWDMQAALANYDLEISWKEWIFEESRRRLAVVYRVLNMLVYFEPATMCNLQTDLILAPLPAKKQLWEAKGALQWHLERERDPQTKVDFGLAADGELVELDAGQVYGSDLVLTYKLQDDSSAKSANWEEWCSGMDAFGGLVMLAALLQG